jgi:hypothetical protein
MSDLKTLRGRAIAEIISVDVESTELEAVILAEAKSYARITTDAEDLAVRTLIKAGQEAFEAFTGKLIYERTVTVEYEIEYYENKLYLPWLPIVSITSVKNEYDEDVDYELKGDYIEVDSTKNVTVVYEAGLVDSNTVPNQLKLGLLKWIVSNYEDRQDNAGMTIQEMPNSSKHHWIKYKTYHI